MPWNEFMPTLQATRHILSLWHGRESSNLHITVNGERKNVQLILIGGIAGTSDTEIVSVSDLSIVMVVSVRVAVRNSTNFLSSIISMAEERLREGFLALRKSILDFCEKNLPIYGFYVQIATTHYGNTVTVLMEDW